MIITDYLNKTAVTHGNKAAFVDETRQLTFSELQQEAYHIASALLEKNITKKPVAIFMDKGVACISAVYGVAYSGNFYTVIDMEMPDQRIDKILTSLKPAAILATDQYVEHAKSLCDKDRMTISYEDCMRHAVCKERIIAAESRIIDTDVA